jgi:hypothetical protein
MAGSTTASEPSQMATHIHFQRDWLHGDWTSIATGANAVSAALQLDCIYCSVVDSQISEIERPGAEHHGISTQGSQLKIDHNWIEGGSVPLLSGGFGPGSPTIAGYVSYCDIEFRRNRGTWPFAWLGQSPIAAGTNANWPGVFALLRKNLYENKEGCRTLVDGNILENVDNSGGQSGAGISIDVRNSSNGASDSNYQAVSHDNTIADNIERNLCAGEVFQTSSQSQGGGSGYQESSLLFANNLRYNASGTNYGCSVNSGIKFNGTGNTWQGTVAESADGQHVTFTAICSVDNTGCPGQISGITIAGGTCVAGTGSRGTLMMSAPDIAGGNHATASIGCSGSNFVATMQNNGTGYLAPTATLTCNGTGCGVAGVTIGVTVVSASGYTPLAGVTGYKVLDMQAGDPVAITQCQVPALNTVGTTLWQGNTYLPSAVGPPASAGSAPWSGSFSPAGVSVTAPWVASAGLSDTSGYCKLTNLQGGPGKNFQWVHNTMIGDAPHQITSGNGINNNVSDGPNYQTNFRLQNDIFVGPAGGGWYNNPVGIGTPTEQFDFDALNTLTADHVVWPGQTGSLYTAYGNDPQFPAAAPIMYFPATASCAGATADATCVGFTGAMNAAAMPLTLSDYHGFGLRSDSLFYAGSGESASDGTSMGSNLGTVDAAQVQNSYVCVTQCGVPGPFPDSAGVAPMSLFGFTENSTAASNYPTVPYEMQRFWDSPPLQWPSINTAAGVFAFSNLDTALAQAYANGARESMYTLARTPPWATSAPTDNSCAYVGSASGGGNGECDAPSDLNRDGSGTNAIWKAWITAIATHVNSPGYLQSHSHIRYWEIWNEADTPMFWSGSFAQLARLTEDANCIITGRGMIHQSGDGSATPCAATQIDPTAKIVMASAHAKNPALSYGQNELYCNNTAGVPAYELPCPNPANAIATAVDVLNFHMKPGNESGNNCPAPTPCTPESAMQWYLGNVHGILQGAELAKPLWNGEGAYSTGGFTGAYSDADMAASFMPRFYSMNWSLGVTGIEWYTWDALAAAAPGIGTAYQQTYNWLANSSLISPCAATGNMWSCTISKSGTPYLILWDASQSCSGGVCTTSNQNVATKWTQYRGMTTASTPANIVGHQVPVGIKPVVLN